MCECVFVFYVCVLLMLFCCVAARLFRCVVLVSFFVLWNVCQSIWLCLLLFWCLCVFACCLLFLNAVFVRFFECLCVFGCLNVFVCFFCGCVVLLFVCVVALCLFPF